MQLVQSILDSTIESEARGVAREFSYEVIVARCSIFLTGFSRCLSVRRYQFPSMGDVQAATRLAWCWCAMLPPPQTRVGVS